MESINCLLSEDPVGLLENADTDAGQRTPDTGQQTMEKTDNDGKDGQTMEKTDKRWKRRTAMENTVDTKSEKLKQMQKRACCKTPTRLDHWTGLVKRRMDSNL